MLSGEEWRRSSWPIARGSVIGFLAGLIPGPATVLSTFIAYSVERRISKTPERFGTGAIEGVAGPEAANNGATAGAMDPLASLRRRRRSASDSRPYRNRSSC